MLQSLFVPFRSLLCPFVPICARLFPIAPSPPVGHSILQKSKMAIEINNNGIIISPTSPKQLAAFYGVSTKVLRTWLRPHASFNQKKNRVYDLEQMFEIIELIGLPVNYSCHSDEGGISEISIFKNFEEFEMPLTSARQKR